jgi:hypothetical protein
MILLTNKDHKSYLRFSMLSFWLVQNLSLFTEGFPTSGNDMSLRFKKENERNPCPSFPRSVERESRTFSQRTGFWLEPVPAGSKQGDCRNDNFKDNFLVNEERQADKYAVNL